MAAVTAAGFVVALTGCTAGPAGPSNSAPNASNSPAQPVSIQRCPTSLSGTDAALRGDHGFVTAGAKAWQRAVWCSYWSPADPAGERVETRRLTSGGQLLQAIGGMKDSELNQDAACPAMYQYPNLILVSDAEDDGWFVVNVPNDECGFATQEFLTALDETPYEVSETAELSP